MAGTHSAERPGPGPRRHRPPGRGAGPALAVGVLLLSLAALACPGGPVAADEPAPAAPPTAPWRDQALRERLFEAALKEVEAECGAPFRTRPTLVLATRREVAQVLVGQLGILTRLLQASPEEVDQAATQLARFVMALCDHDRGRILLADETLEELPGQVERGASFGVDELRVLLVHEATHAFDFERHDVDAARARATSMDEVQALAALTEGHAQLIAKHVAARTGRTAAFERLTRWIVSPPHALSRVERDRAAAALAQASFAYVEGLKFFEAVFAARGREGVEAALAALPTDLGAIERPERWLAGAPTGATADLKQVLQALRPGFAPGAWRVIETRVAQAALKAAGSTLPEPERSTFAEGLTDARVLVAAQPAAQVQVTVMLLAFGTPAQARAYLHAERLSGERALDALESGTVRERRLGEGAGAGDLLEGWHKQVLLQVGATEVAVLGEAARVGPNVVELVVQNAPWIERAQVVELVERARRALEQPGAEPGPALTPWPSDPSERRVRLSVLGPDGSPVPRAWAQGADAAPRGERVPVRDGVAELVVRRGSPRRVSVYGAGDAAGAPLPLAPRLSVPLPDGGGTVEVRLERGRSLEGLALRLPERAPAAGVQVKATPDPGRGLWASALADDAVLAEATTDAEGRYRLLGLGPDPVVLHLREDGEEPANERWEATPGEEGPTLFVAPLHVVVLTLRDGAGAPVVGATVQARQWPSGAGASETREARGLTDGQGRVSLRGLLPDEEATLEVDPPAAREDLARSIDRGWSPRTSQLSLAPGRTLRGQVLDAEGRPVHARVLVREGRYGTRDLETDDGGRFRLPHLPRGPAEVGALPPLEGLSDVLDRTEPRWVEVAADVDEVTLRLEPRAASVTLEVVGPDGSPVAQADAALLVRDERRSLFLRGGRATFREPSEGSYGLVALRPRGADGAALPFGPGRLRDVRPVDGRVVLRLPRGRAVLGRVLGPDGAPVAGVRVEAAVPWRLRAPGESWEPDHDRATTDERGLFRLVSLERRPYALEVAAPERFAPHPPLRLEADQDALLLRLAAGRRITVTVVDAQGRPVAGARVGADYARGKDADDPPPAAPPEARTDGAGRAPLGPLAPGRALSVRVEPPAGATDLLPALADLTEAGDLRVVLPPGFVAQGRVVDAAGRPVEGAAVWSGGPPFARKHAVLTDAEGRFRTAPLPLTGSVLRASRDLDERPDEQERGRRVTPDVGEVTLTLR